ncbi:MAG: hypothetical protein Q8O52_17075 [Sulfuritalea sp.]|nr:hypothetical protein [Sulfuritalea sp.]
MNPTPPTEAKTRAIRLALDANGDETHNSHVAMLLAMLTSANRDEREHAKGMVRGYVAQGERIRIKAEEAAALDSFANRHEP